MPSMIRYSLFAIFSLGVFLPLSANAQVTVLDEPFDDQSQFTATPMLESAGETSDYYRLTDSSDIAPSFVGFDGDFFAAQDTNGVTGAAATSIVMDWTNLAIAGLSNIELSVLIAEDDSSDGNEDWDSDSSVIFQYQIDGGGFQDLLAFESMTTGFNSEPAQDTDFDGLGDGAALTETPTTFMATIAGSGNNLDLRVTVSFLDDGDEDVAFDDVVITADGTPVAVDPVINEFVANHIGDDTNEYVEIEGTPDTDYSAYSVLQLSGDNDAGGTLRGQILNVLAVGSSDSNGLFVTAFLDSVLSNTTQSLLLVENFTGMPGDDLDTNDDGVLDSTPWTRVVDDIAVTDAGAGDVTYAVVTLTPDFDGGSSTVGGASRIPNGADTDNVADWLRNDFDGAGIPALDPGTPELGEAFNTPGTENDEVESSDLPVTCGAPATLISAVQGNGFTSPQVGNEVEIEGVVVGDFQNGVAGELNGYFVQEEDTDADMDTLTSEGIFVFAPDNMLTISVGDQLRVRGSVEESFGFTRITGVTGIALCSDSGRGLLTATPAMISLPISDELELESVEGMAVILPQTLTVSDQFNVVRFGEVTLSNGRIIQPTNQVLPGAAANNQQALNDLNMIVLDDGRDGSNVMPFVVGRDDLNPINAGNPVRNGYQVTDLHGVLSFAFGDYRVQPTQAFTFDENANPRQNMPELADSILTVASFNVLNFFTTLDNAGSICGPASNQGCRGADSASELTRQTDKIVAAILGLDAQLVGLVELENNASASLQGLVDALNAVAGAGAWDFIDTGTIGSDVIKVGIIYTPAAVTPMGTFALLDSAVDPRFDSNLNRPAPAQSFMDNDGEVFTVVINHLKSKGCGGATGLDADQGDGQACFNETRRQAALALADWINTDPTSSGDPDFLILGDLNAYAMEDPIRAIADGGLLNLGSEFEGPDAYSFQFFGQAGTLDYAIATPELAAQVLDTVHWHINADELPGFNYNEENLAGGLIKPADFYQPDAFRASDHDAIVVALNLGPGIVDASNPATMLAVDRSFALADGIDSVQVMLQLVNAGGMPIPGVAVSLAVTDSAMLGQTTGVTDMNGQFTTTLTNTVIESVTVSGQFDLSGDGVPDTDISNGSPRTVSFEDEDFIFGDGFE